MPLKASCRPPVRFYLFFRVSTGLKTPRTLYRCRICILDPFCEVFSKKTHQKYCVPRGQTFCYYYSLLRAKIHEQNDYPTRRVEKYVLIHCSSFFALWLWECMETESWCGRSIILKNFITDSRVIDNLTDAGSRWNAVPQLQNYSS